MTGQTGSGKTYGLLYLLLFYRMRNADVSVCDPKVSDLADLSKTMGSVSATSKNEIIEEVRQNILRNGATKATTTERRLEDLDHC